MLTDEFFLATKLYHKKFNELCQPMAKYLGTTQAMYGQVDQQGGIFTVCNDKTWVERWLENSYYRLDPVMVHPNNIHNGFAFFDASQSQEFKDEMLYDAVINFNWYLSFVYVEKLADGSFFWYGFGTSQENYQLTSRLINEAPIVKKFIKNLHKTLITTIKDQQTHKMDFAALKGDLFHSQKGLVYNEADEKQRQLQSLKEIGLLNNDDNQIFLSQSLLSPQEINSLKSYLISQSIKKVSKDLNLAVTTVTRNLENIKTKLNCNDKNELFVKAEILASLGHL